eukprot:scaffold1042_cov401-Prasinococcus_capsulatus_cf.AAC.7
MGAVFDCCCYGCTVSMDTCYKVNPRVSVPNVNAGLPAPLFRPVVSSLPPLAKPLDQQAAHVQVPLRTVGEAVLLRRAKLGPRRTAHAPIVCSAKVLTGCPRRVYGGRAQRTCPSRRP